MFKLEKPITNIWLAEPLRFGI